MNDDVDRLADQRVERRQRQVAPCVGQLADEAQPGERLTSRPGVDRGVALHPGRQRAQQRQCLVVAHLTDDGHVGRHAQEAGDELTQGDLLALAPTATGLHRGDVGQRNVGLEYLFGHDDPQ